MLCAEFITIFLVNKIKKQRRKNTNFKKTKFQRFMFGRRTSRQMWNKEKDRRWKPKETENKSEQKIIITLCSIKMTNLTRITSLSWASAFSLSSTSCCLKVSHCCWDRLAAFNSRSSISRLCSILKSANSCCCRFSILWISGSILLTVNSCRII